VRAHAGLSDYFRELVGIRYRGAPGQHLLLPDPIATVMPTTEIVTIPNGFHGMLIG